MNLFSNLFGTSTTAASNSTTLKELRSNTDVLNYEGPTEKCSICQDDILENQIIRKLNNCNHIFHIRCIERWLEANNRCPHCRASIISDEANEDNETETNDIPTV